MDGFERLYQPTLTYIMKYHCHFSVGLAHDRFRPGDVTFEAQGDYVEVLKTKLGTSPPNPYVYNIKAEWGDAKLQSVLNLILDRTGKRPLNNPYFADAALDKYYVVNVERIPEPHELDEARWLYLAPPLLSLAEFKAVETDGSYVIQKVFRSKKIAYGSTRTVGEMLLFTEALKERFLQSDLRGIEFRSVKLITGEPSGLWHLMTEARMPPLAMELVVGMKREPFTGDDSQGAGPKEVGYFPMVLRYKESELTSLPDVDLIFSAERLGWTSHNNHRMHIVSQRFRQVADKLAPGLFKYGLVAIGEGEELQRRYTIPELDPPSA